MAHGKDESEESESESQVPSVVLAISTRHIRDVTENGVTWREQFCKQCRTWMWVQYYIRRSGERSERCYYCETRKDRHAKHHRPQTDRFAGARKWNELMWAQREKADKLKKLKKLRESITMLEFAE